MWPLSKAAHTDLIDDYDSTHIGLALTVWTVLIYMIGLFTDFLDCCSSL